MNPNLKDLFVCVWRGGGGGGAGARERGGVSKCIFFFYKVSKSIF